MQFDTEVILPTVDGVVPYALNGVVVHQGEEVSAGHYMSYVLNTSNNQWWNADDEQVRHVSLL